MLKVNILIWTTQIIYAILKVVPKFIICQVAQSKSHYCKKFQSFTISTLKNWLGSGLINFNITFTKNYKKLSYSTSRQGYSTSLQLQERDWVGWNFLKRPMVLFTLLKQMEDESSIIPRSWWVIVEFTSVSLKKAYGWIETVFFPTEYYFLRLFVRIGIKLNFPLKSSFTHFL